ncbi:acetyl-CoA hydrolase/transferase family protein [Natranaerofaba carboxydovora]|uniref:acetyl-CoA hydrolase/transferase family protein n=1 Tax=Natranaerofaba carboxydovora TaxID=2742683 RepID=UPI001F1331F0|nr:acetyl-CoA hydrolase/transferase family protein [Natranaerofaba carboxydovora]UMZ74329.1 Succinyl-CoA:coenzyme A transferase [Natranaerofaba carboxydovora]
MKTDRILNSKLYKKVISADQAANIIENNMTVATSGFTLSGYPTEVPLAIARKAEKEKNFKINLYTGASVGEELDKALADNNAINKRLPYQTNNKTRDMINDQRINYIDLHLSHFPQELRYGFYGKIDVAIIEAASITKEGNIVPTTSVGASPTFCDLADSIIVEINDNKPIELSGMHDIYTPLDPPNREPIPLTSPEDRIGTPYIKVDPDKIKGIVLTNRRKNISKILSTDETSDQIANHLIEFLQGEVLKGRLGKNLLPLQSGVGKVSNAVLKGLSNSMFKDLYFYSEVIQDSVLDLLDEGTIKFASATAFSLSEHGFKKMVKNIDTLKDKIVLRPQEISNHPEIIRRLGSIAMNTAIEIDIFGNVNSSHINGSDLMNGIGGSGDFARNSYMSIFTTPSVAKGGSISAIVPMVTHVDHTEHDVQIVVTEQGLADLRGLAPIERAEAIIENCAHPNFKNLLWAYLEKAKKKSGHTPHLLDKAFSYNLELHPYSKENNVTTLESLT